MTTPSGQPTLSADPGDTPWDSALLTWTYDGSYILARATREDANWQKLYAWWALTSALMLR